MSRPRKMIVQAHEFMVWRAGNSVNWECSVKDLADETGLSTGGIRSILCRRGWRNRVKDGREDAFHEARLPITHWIHS